MAIATIIFRLAKPIALQFMSGEDFSRRRSVWLILTSAGFLSPNFWIYALVAIPLLTWAYRRDSNAVALYLFMLHVIPPVGVIIPILGNNGLFSVDNYRLLAFVVLVPAWTRYRRDHQKNTSGEFGVMDFLLLAYGALQVALYTPPDLPYHAIIPDR